MFHLTRRTTDLAMALSLAALCAVGPARADFWTAAKVAEYASPNGEFVFKVTPRKEKARCKGELFRVEEGKRESVWSRELVNSESPVFATVTDSGDYVITFDEWGRCGELPIVLYGPGGDLLRAFDLEDLGIYPNVDPVGMTVSSVWWRSGALVFTGVPIEEWAVDREMLFVRLSWGRWFVITLQSAEFLRLAPENDKEYTKGQLEKVRAYMKAQAAERIIAMLDDKDDDNAGLGCRLAADEALAAARPKVEAFKARVEQMEKGETRERLLKMADYAMPRLEGRAQKDQKDWARKVHEDRLEELKRAYRKAVEEENAQYKWLQDAIKTNDH